MRPSGDGLSLPFLHPSLSRSQSWWFRKRDLPPGYYIRVGLVWTLIAIVLDYLFIVQLFQASYYGIDVFLYYALTFLIPVGVGLYLVQARGKK